MGFLVISAFPGSEIVALWLKLHHCSAIWSQRLTDDGLMPTGYKAKSLPHWEVRISDTQLLVWAMKCWGGIESRLNQRPGSQSYWVWKPALSLTVVTLGMSLNLAKPVFSFVKWGWGGGGTESSLLGLLGRVDKIMTAQVLPILSASRWQRASESTLHKASFSGKKASSNKTPRNIEYLCIYFSGTFYVTTPNETIYLGK